MIIKRALRTALRSMALFGINPAALVDLRYYPKFRRDLRRWRRSGGQTTHLYPVLSDFCDQAGTASGHYFHQDLLVATLIAQSRPRRHIDVGSRIDGFVAHVASFREIELLDRRALNSTGHSNIVFTQADINNPKSLGDIKTDSLSCLSVIEHLGLGRYGDTIDPNGHLNGFNNLLSLLEIGGTLYLSFPIGKANSVFFNAHRVFHPLEIFKWSDGIRGLKLTRFDYVDDAGKLHQNIDLVKDHVECEFGCGIYTFYRVPTQL